MSFTPAVSPAPDESNELAETSQPSAPAMQKAWAIILGALEVKVNRQSFTTWLKPTRFSYSQGRVIYVRIPSATFQHIGDRYADLMSEAIDKGQLPVDEVRFVTAENDPSEPKTREDGGFAPLPSHSPNAPASQSSLNGHRSPP